jgi:gluconate 5-dehydrogenase
MKNGIGSLFDVSDRVVVITGGGGYLGQAICETLAGQGARVYSLRRSVSVSRNSPSIAGLTHLPCDVRQPKDFAKTLEKILKKEKKIDTLINNANDTQRERWEELNLKKWRDGFRGSLDHYFSCAQVALPYLVKSGSGVIVNVASIFGFLAPDQRVYPRDIRGPTAHHAAAKAGIIQLTRYLAVKFASCNLRVNSISPGWFPKPGSRERPAYLRRIAEKIPLQRIGRAPEIGGPVLFLVSRASEYMTGQNLVVDGGYSTW